MDEKKSNANTTAEDTTTEAPGSAPTTTNEKREAYGTAKTENLRDSGLWRIIIPGAVSIFCLTLFIVPLLILIPLLVNSINGFIHGNAAEAQLLWVWITMIVIELGVAVLIGVGMMRALTTQAGNYPRVSVR